MKTTIAKLALFTVISGVFAAPVMAQPSSTLVFVHGAHFSANSWAAVQAELSGQVSSIAIDLPGRFDSITAAKVSLEISAAALCSSMAKISGEKVLVAHSQGGAVVNASLNICPTESVTKVVYVTSVSPLQGESAFERLSEEDGENYFRGITYNKETSVLEITNTEGFVASFAPKANVQQQAWMKQNAVNEPAALSDAKMQLHQQRFEQLEKHYVFARQDKVISLATQQKVAASMSLTGRYEIDSGHLPMLTHSSELAKILTEITAK